MRTTTQFWKQFFEASANVSLSGYEELAGGEDSTAVTAEGDSTVHEQTAGDYTPRPRSAGNPDDTVTTDQSSAVYSRPGDAQDDSVLSNNDGDLTGSTPRPPATKSLPIRSQFAGLSSPHDALKREYNKTGDDSAAQRRGAAAEGEVGLGEEDDDTSLLFQQHTARFPGLSTTPKGSLEPGGGDDDTDVGKGKNKDPLLHRMLDKNYRITATPHKGATGISPAKWKVEKVATPGKGKEKQRPIWEDSPTSSPEMAVPQLRSAAFLSPMRAAYKGKQGAPRTPGVSVQTPVAGRKTKDVFGGGGEKSEGAKKYADEITWESDSDDALGGMSPPKTIQFALPPSKLLRTPGAFCGSTGPAACSAEEDGMLTLLTSSRGEQAHRRRHPPDCRRRSGGIIRVQPDDGQDEPRHPRRYVLTAENVKNGNGEMKHEDIKSMYIRKRMMMSYGQRYDLSQVSPLFSLGGMLPEHRPPQREKRRVQEAPAPPVAIPAGFFCSC